MGIQIRDSDFDVAYDWQPGQDNILQSSENGYKDIKQRIRQKNKNLKKGYDINQAEENRFLSAFDIENLDGEKGFSYFERRLAVHLIEGRMKPLTTETQSTLLRNDYPGGISFDYRSSFPAYWSALSLALVELPVAERTWESVESFQEQFEMGLFYGSENSVASDLSNPIIREGFEAGLAFRSIEEAYFLFKDQNPRVPVSELMTNQDLMFEGLYGDMGVYEVGSFETEGVYSAYVSHVDYYSPVYGELFAARVFKFFQDLKDSGKWQPGQTFTVYEHGGGDGKLAIDFLTYAQNKAQTDPDWNEFWQSLSFVGMEIAMSAYEIQKEIEKQFPDKFRAELGNAITDHPEEKGMGVVLSSLLIDSFPQHKLVNQHGEWQTTLQIPTMVFDSKKERNQFLREHFGIQKRKVLRSSNAIQKDYLRWPKENSQITLSFTNEQFQTYISQLSKKRSENPSEYRKAYDFFRGSMEFIEVSVPVEDFPEIASYIDFHNLNENQEQHGRIIWINTEADRYYANVTQYFEKGCGAIMTSDLFYNRAEGSAAVSAQSPDFDKPISIDEISMSLFGDFVFYAGLEEQDLFNQLPKMSYQSISIDSEASLWNYHPDYNSFPTTMIDKAYEDYKEKVRGNGFSDQNIMSREEFAAEYHKQFEDSDFHILFATF